MIEVDLHKQQTLDADPSVIREINFTANQIEQEMQQCFSLMMK